MANYNSVYTGEQIDNAVAAAGTALQPANIKQTTGESQISVMSQKAVTDQLTAIVNGTTTVAKATTATTAVKAQKAIYKDSSTNYTLSYGSTSTGSRLTISEVDRVLPMLPKTVTPVTFAQGNSWTAIYGPVLNDVPLLINVKVFSSPTSSNYYESTFQTIYTIGTNKASASNNLSSLIIPIKCVKTYTTSASTFDDLTLWIAPGTSSGFNLASSYSVYARLTADSATGYQATISVSKIEM